MLLSILILLALAAASPLLVRALGARAGLLISAVSLGIAAWFGTKFATVTGGETILETTSWVPSLGVELAFRLDGLALLFAILISGIGGFVLLYTSSYLGKSPGLGRFYTTLLTFMAAMLGLVLADNLIVMFIFWELTSITSFLLIGFDFHRESARRCAWQSLVVTGMGGLFLLAGILLLAIAAGSATSPEFSIGAILASDVVSSPLYTPAAILILVGCFSKSAMVPFHFWLPNAMEAPSPVSALLHSSTMVKAGVYLIARLHPTMSGERIWDDSLVIFGGATMLLGAILATRHVAFKKILAYSTVSSLGMLVMLIGIHAYTAAATYLLAHALFKACLFLVAGSAIHVAGTKDTEAIGNLRSAMPISAISVILGGLSLAGMMPFLGFAGKELILKAGLSSAPWAIFLAPATAISAVLTVFAAYQVAFKPFFMKGTHEIAHPH
ncbi:MAG: proton-conducting transporter membrane subunit, partial [Phycisphaerales bacterium]